MQRDATVSAQRPELSIDEYVSGVCDANTAVLARALTLVESHHPRHQQVAEELLTRLLPLTGGSLRLGITGVPGAGKSTFIEALGTQLLEAGRRVAVLAIDPSSGISGGSILGDKTRMPKLAQHPAAYVRPSPSAGTLGGVARKTRETMLVCEAAGYDVVMIETVGVGQSETAVAQMVDCLLALMLPGAGDELQAIKRGLLEVVDVVAVNKADGPLRQAAERAAGQYRSALPWLSRLSGKAPAVHICSAQERHGIDEVWNTILARYDGDKSSGDLQRRRQQQNLHWLWAIVEDHLRHKVHGHAAVRAIRDDLERSVLDSTTPALVAARRILEACGLS